MTKEIIDNREKYLERVNLYKKFGCDTEKERKFIIDKARPFYGDILEIGTGKGHLTMALAQEDFKFITIDPSQEEQNYAKMNIQHLGLEKNVDFKVENGEAMSFANDSFDIVISANTVHHLNNAFLVMDEIIRVLKPKGKIVLSDFTAQGLELVDKIHQQEGRSHHPGKIGLKQIKEYFQDKKFNIQKLSSKFQEVLIASN